MAGDPEVVRQMLGGGYGRVAYPPDFALYVAAAGPQWCAELTHEIAEAKRTEAIRLLESLGYIVTPPEPR